MAEVAEAKFVMSPAMLVEFYKLPGVHAALLATGRVVTASMKSNVSGPRVKPFAKRAFVRTDPTDRHAVVAGTTWKLAHLFEFGSANTAPHGWLRSACTGVPGTRFEPGQRGGSSGA
jgi:hypothetical protein